MARQMTDVYPAADREDASLEIPTRYVRAGTWHAEIRARLVDDGDWCFDWATDARGY